MRSALFAAALCVTACGSEDSTFGDGRLGNACKEDSTCATPALRCTNAAICGWSHENPGNVGFEGGPCIERQTCTSGLECLGSVCGKESDVVQIDLASGPPRFSWTGFRAASVFVVRKGDERALLWGVRSQDGLDSPVVFGNVPGGSEKLGSESALPRGATYFAVVVRYDGTEDIPTIYGEFTP